MEELGDITTEKKLESWSFADIVALRSYIQDKFKSTQFVSVATVNKWIDILDECDRELESIILITFPDK